MCSSRSVVAVACVLCDGEGEGGVVMTVGIGCRCIGIMGDSRSLKVMEWTDRNSGDEGAKK